MIDEDRSGWTLGQLADEVIEACELPMGCRGTIIAALGDAKDQGRAENAKYADSFKGLLRESVMFITGDLNLMCRPDETDRECMNRSRRELLERIDAALAKNPAPTSQVGALCDIPGCGAKAEHQGATHGGFRRRCIAHNHPDISGPY